MANIGLISPENLDAFIELIPPVLRGFSVNEEGFLFYGLDEEDQAVGVIVLKEAADTLELRYMYVLPELRGSGIMDQAIVELLLQLRDEDFNYLVMKYIPDEYPVMRHLSRRFRFEETVLDYGYFKFRAEDVKKSKATSIVPTGIIRYKYLPPEKRGNLNKLVNKYMQMYDLRFISKEEILPYSLAYMEGDEPKGALLVEIPSGFDGPVVDDLRKYPEAGAFDITLFFVGSGGQKTPLYLLSAFCQMIGKEFPENALITGYFPEGHVSKLIEGALGVQGHHEVMAKLDLSTL